MTRVQLAILSVCSCGHPVLEASIPLGTEFLIEESNRGHCTLICGGCKRHIELDTVYVYARGRARGGQLPVVIFNEI